MIIGTRRPEEARVFDADAGYHQFHDLDGVAYGSFEVFWGEDYNLAPGWYWHACFPGCLPDGEPFGPFGSSMQAVEDAEL